MSKPTDVGTLLNGLHDAVAREIATTPAVQPREGSFAVATLPITARLWHQIADVVAVVVDLKNSTKLSTNKWARSTASLYEASTGNVTRIFEHFDANFVQIQGDGAFALFWGKGRYERAMCAAITIHTFGADLVKQLQKRWPEQPKTGLKIGVASGRVLAKRLGIPRNPALQEPVWAGKPVNYATKAAQCVASPSIIITASVWKAISYNEYLTQVCKCSTRTDRHVWTTTNIRKLPDGDAQAEGRKSTYRWCSKHVAADCQAVLAGQTKRVALTNSRATATSSKKAVARPTPKPKASGAGARTAASTAATKPPARTAAPSAPRRASTSTLKRASNGSTKGAAPTTRASRGQAAAVPKPTVKQPSRGARAKPASR